MEFLLPSKVTSFFLSFFFQTNTVVLTTSITSIFTCHSFDSIFLPLLCDCSSFFSILFTFLFSLFGGYSMFQLTLLSCFVSKLLCFFFSLLGVNVHLHAHHLHTPVHFLGNNRFDDGWGIGSFPQQCLIGDSTGITGTRDSSRYTDKLCTNSFRHLVLWQPSYPDHSIYNINIRKEFQYNSGHHSHLQYVQHFCRQNNMDKNRS
mmetsp:Transcript_42715/g.46376  ORF Transcript_42715/g.46376 Transcript_42715/m.46376 type:complete len:204 (+) Transcript_42715:607-1218(+)